MYLVFAIVMMSIGQTKALEKECKGVPENRMEQIKKRTQEASDRGTPFGRISKEIRAWVKTDFDDVSDDCVVEIVRSIAGKRDQGARAKARADREKANKEEWEKLTHAQKRWLIYVRDGLNKPKRNLEVGNMGKLGMYAKVISVVSESEVLIKFPIDIDGGRIAWVTGVDTSRLTTDSWIDSNAIYWVPGTKTYPTAMGGTNTVFVLELIPQAEVLQKAVSPPHGVKLEDFPPK